MGWRDWSYWVKGGLIFDVLVILVGLILLPFKFEWCIFTCTKVFYSLYLYFPVAYMIKSIFGDNFGFNSNLGNLLLVTTLSIVFYFVIGAIIGWIYGKIKQRREQKR